MTTQFPKLIYKITTAQLWTDAQAAGQLKGMPIDEADGYMHFSTADQLQETLRLHFKGQDDLYVLAVATDEIEQNLKWEPSRGGALFPHLYGVLPVSLIKSSISASVDQNGNVNLSEAK